jgi:hypothetical protein
MTYNSNSKAPKGLHIGEVLKILFVFILVFFGFLVLVEMCLTFVFGGVDFSADKAIFVIVASSFRLAVALPLVIIFALGTFAGLPRLIQIIIGLIIAWIIALSFDFFWSNMIQARVWGFDVVVDSALTPVGFLVGLILASRDVVLAACAAYLALWRDKK